MSEYTREEAGKEGVGMGIPSRMLGPLLDYAFNHRPTGDFLRSVAENDLRMTVAHADPENSLLLKQYSMWFHNFAPPKCHGNRKLVADWTKQWGVV